MNEKQINGQQVSDVISITSQREVAVIDSKDEQMFYFPMHISETCAIFSCRSDKSRNSGMLFVR